MVACRVDALFKRYGMLTFEFRAQHPVDLETIHNVRPAHWADWLPLLPLFEAVDAKNVTARQPHRHEHKRAANAAFCVFSIDSNRFLDGAFGRSDGFWVLKVGEGACIFLFSDAIGLLRLYFGFPAAGNNCTPISHLFYNITII